MNNKLCIVTLSYFTMLAKDEKKKELKSDLEFYILDEK